MKREFKKTPWWMKTDKYCKSPTTTDHYASLFYKDGKALTNKEVVDTLNNQDKKIKEQQILIEVLQDEVEQHKAVIDKKWSEYLKKKEVI